MADERRILTCTRLKQYEDKPQNLKVVKRKEAAQKAREAGEQGDLSENAEYNTVKDEQRDIKLYTEELEKPPKNVEVVVKDETNLDKINVGCKIKLLDAEYDGEMEFYIVGLTEANSLQNKISNESPVGRVLIGKVVGDCVDVETQAGGIQYKVLEIRRVSQAQHKGVKDVGERQKVKQADTDSNHTLKVRRDKLVGLQAAGKGPFQIIRYDAAAHSMDVKDGYGQWEGEEAAIVGCMMSRHIMGKAPPCNVQDLKGSVQAYVAKDSVGEESYKDFKKMDIGDTAGVKGKAFTTKTGEASTHATEVTLLFKGLQVLPERFHGLADTDTRYHQCYVDLTMNVEVKDTFTKHSRILATIREYLGGEGFMETETPMLASNAGDAVARSSETHSDVLDEDFKLRIPPEPYLKRPIIDGLKRVYEVGRAFHSEDLGTRHNPEFILMELYQTYTGYNGMMDLIEKLHRSVVQEVLGTTIAIYKGVEMDLGKLFTRITMVDAVKKYAGVDSDQIHTLEEARAITKEGRVGFKGRHKKGGALSLSFEESAEEHLVRPTFILGHSVEISPLIKKKPDNPDYVGRFEFFMNSWEMANTYSEINDPIDQRKRLRAQGELLTQGNEETNHTDEDFLNALEVGMPPTGGVRFGADRMIILLTDSPTVGDAPLFLTMESIDK